jgi:hypothetical protein
MSISRRQTWLFSLLLISGVLVRVYGAWLCREDTSSDRGRVGMMALHMAQGRDWPVFFYGGAYLGSVEPAASALFIRVFGPSGFALNMGTAAFGILLLFLLAVWAREAAGLAAAVIALMLSVVGPFGYFYFLASPRGGYAATLFFGAAVLWLAGRFVLKALTNSKPTYWESVALGLSAGLAWWSHQLSAAALATAALVIAWAGGRSLFSPRYWTAGLAFFAGSAPWWIWNAAHGWATFRLAGSFGAHMPFSEGLRMFFGERLLEVADLPALPTKWAMAFAIAAAFVLVGGLGALASRIRRSGPTAQRCHAMVILLFVLVSAILYARSHYALNRSTRYLLPLLSPLAVMAGTGFALLRYRVARIAGMALAIGLMVGQVFSVRNAFLENRDKHAAWRDVPKLAAFCRQQGIEALYGNIWQHWINFASAEQCLVCDLMAEPYAPYARAAERATKCALLGNYENLSAFLAATRATGQVTRLGQFTVQYDFSPPTNAAAPLATAHIARMTDEHGQDLTPLCDDTVGAAVEWNITPDNAKEIVIELERSEPVCGLRLRCSEHYYPWRISVEGQSGHDSPWQPLLPETVGTLFFWSGPRWYWFGLFHREEFSWPAQLVSRIRIRFPPAERTYPVRLEEVTLICDAGARRLPTSADIENLRRVLQSLGTKRVYADRWLSAQLAAEPHNGWTVPQPSFTRRSVHSLIEPTRAEYVELENIGPDAGFVIEPTEESQCAQRFTELGIKVQKEAVPPWVVLRADTGACDPAVVAVPGLQWTGCTMMKLAPVNFLKKRAAWHLERARTMAGERERASEIQKALHEYPNFSQFVDGTSFRAGPRKKPLARFAGEVELVAVEWPQRSVAPGETVTVTYQWRCATDVVTDDRVVFAHFENADYRFQDDHPLLAFIPEQDFRFQPFPGEVFTETRTLQIPPDAPAGDYFIRLGIYRAHTGERERMRSELPVKRRALILARPLRVRPPD